MSDIIGQLKNLLQLAPKEVYDKIFNMPYITIRRKISILAACLNDNKKITFNKYDPKSREIKIMYAINDLENLLNKKKLLQQK